MGCKRVAPEGADSGNRIFAPHDGSLSSYPTEGAIPGYRPPRMRGGPGPGHQMVLRDTTKGVNHG